MHPSPFTRCGLTDAGLAVAPSLQSFIAHESVTRVMQERIKLTLVDHSSGLLLERVLTEADGSILAQALPVFAPNDAARFAASDIYQSQLNVAYLDILHKVEAFFHQKNRHE